MQTDAEKAEAESADVTETGSKAGLIVGLVFFLLFVSSVGIAAFVFYRRWSRLPVQWKACFYFLSRPKVLFW